MEIDHAEAAESAEKNVQPRVSAFSAPSARKESGDAEPIVDITRSWIGTPYVHQASLKGVGCDCLGLLRGLWRELHGDEPEGIPPYSPDWAETTGNETLYLALKRHAREVTIRELAHGDVALFRMLPHGPAKHCGIVAARAGQLTLIHAGQNKRVSEEPLSPFWRTRLAFAFRL
jgi:NlpC/P60 family putative phage cell wall peptidase